MAAFDARIVVLALRIAQAILAIIVLGLTAYVADWWSGYYYGDAPSEVSFLIFTSVWTLLALVYLIVVPWRFSDTPAHHKFAILSVEAVTAVFWFAGFIALAVFLTGRVCSGSVCSAAQAACVFAAFDWLAFAGTTGMAVLHVLRTNGRASEPNHADPKVNVAQGT